MLDIRTNGWLGFGSTRVSGAVSGGTNDTYTDQSVASNMLSLISIYKQVTILSHYLFLAYPKAFLFTSLVSSVILL